MKIEFLGAYGGSTSAHNLTSFLIDDYLAIDAGCLSQALSLERQFKISDVLISHTHLDHTLSLPFLADNLFGQKNEPLRVWASEHVIEAIKTHIFNEVTWPDFSSLPSPEQPTISFSALLEETTFSIRHLQITATPVHHVVPCWGYFIESEKSDATILYTADTCSTERIWELANEKRNLKAVIVDCSFPNDMEDLAVASGHMTPRLLARDLAKLRQDCQILIYHLKPTYQETLLQELAALNDPRLVLSLQDKILTL